MLRSWMWTGTVSAPTQRPSNGPATRRSLRRGGALPARALVESFGADSDIVSTTRAVREYRHGEACWNRKSG